MKCANPASKEKVYIPAGSWQVEGIKKCRVFIASLWMLSYDFSSHWLPVATNWKKYINWNIELAIQPTQGNKSTCECELVDRLGHILPSMDS